MGSLSGPVHAPAWREFINELGDPLLMPGTTVDALYGDSNANIQKLLAKYTFPEPDSSIKTEDITLNDGVWVRIYTPPDLASTDLTIFMHGGGWVMGSVHHEDAAVRGICAATKKTVVSIGYRLAPKHRFPVALDDCLYATLWALEHFSASTSSAVLMGGSAGANLAFGVALKLLDAGMGDKFKGVLALVPCVVHPDAVPVDKRDKFTSYEENAVATVNTLAAMKCFLDSYGPPADDVYFSVLLHPRIQELKKVYIVECGADTLRDDARLMRDALEEVGVPLKYDAYEGFPHYFWSYPSKFLEADSDKFHQTMFAAVDWLHE
ncbi:Alpha/Beta hydrolase protein [Aspergillus carlsbadensis]|nr:Alpha/Beta hydrolase protein [Aspergillus carlsbadensis]